MYMYIYCMCSYSNIEFIEEGDSDLVVRSGLSILGLKDSVTFELVKRFLDSLASLD